MSADPGSDRTATEQPVRDLLRRFSSLDASAAWVEFLDRYSPRILQVIRCCERGEDDVADAFLWVCERLADRQFRRLRMFDAAGPASFTTWLSVVVQNLARDWHRATFGRRRLQAIVDRLPAFDRAVFGLVVERGVAIDRALPLLRQTFPSASVGDLDRSHDRLVERLGRNPARLHAEPDLALDDPSRRIDPAGDGPSPEALILRREDRRSLRRALAKLPDADRVLLRLRYEHGLTLGEVARASGLKDPQTADRRLRAAVARLKSFMGL